MSLLNPFHQGKPIGWMQQQLFPTRWRLVGLRNSVLEVVP
jgi:hypothetical protein